jgi:hypothetical protein
MQLANIEKINIKFITFFVLIVYVFTSCKSIVKTQYHVNEYITATININDTIGKCIFDTGSSFFCIDSIFAKKKIFSKKGFNYMISGAGDSREKVFIIKDTLNFYLNNSSFSNNINVVLNLKKIVGNNADFISGNYLFSNYNVRVDSKKNTFEPFTDLTIDLSKFKKIPFLLINGKVIINANLFFDKKNNITGKFLIDTGDPGQISINNSDIVFDLEKKIKNKVYYESIMAGIGGKSTGFRFNSLSIDILNYNVTNIITNCTKNNTGGLSTANYFDGTIGYGFLKKFDFIVDFKSKLLYLKPNYRFNIQYLHPPLGFSYIDLRNEAKGLKVISIIKNSPAVIAGILLNDQILQINNIPIDKIDLDKFVDKLKASDVLLLKIKRGNEDMEIKFKLNVFFKT